MGLTAVQRVFKIYQKLTQYYGHELEAFNEKHQGYWEQYINVCCPILHEKIDMEDMELILHPMAEDGKEAVGSMT